MNQDNLQHPPQRSGKVPSKWRKLWLALTLMLVGVIGLIAATPMLLSTQQGRTLALNSINNSIDGRLQVADLKLAWFSGQSIEGLVLRDSGGATILELDQFSTELTLLQALLQKLSLGQTIIRGIHANIVLDDQGNNNIAQALGSDANNDRPTGSSFIFPITGNVALIEGRISITAPRIEAVVFDALSGAIEMNEGERSFRFNLAGQSRQGQLKGNFTVTGQARNILSTSSDLGGETAQLDINATINELPVDGIDRLLNMQGILSTALGDRVSVQIESTGDTQQQALVLRANTPKANLSLTGLVNKNRFRLTEPANLELELSPQLIDVINHGAAEDSALHLANPVPLNLTLGQLRLPIDGFKPDEISVHAGLDATAPIQLNGIKHLGEVIVSGFRIALVSNNLGGPIELRIDGRVTSRNESGDLKISASIDELFRADGDFHWQDARINAEASIGGVPTIVLDNISGLDGLLVEALGPKFDLTTTAISSENTETIQAMVHLKSKQLDTGAVHFLINDQISLSKPASIEFDITLDLMEHLSQDSSNTPLLTEIATLNSAIDTLAVSISPFELSSLKSNGQVNMDRATISEVDSFSKASLENTQLTFDISGKDDGNVQLKLKTDVVANNESAPIRIDANIQQLFNKSELSVADANLEVSASLKNTPTSILASLSGQSELSTILGPSLDLVIDGEISPDKDDNPIAVDIDAPNLKTNLTFNMTEVLELREPTELQFTLTPASYRALTESRNDVDGVISNLRLTQPALFHSRIEKLSWPLGERFDPSQAVISMDLQTDGLSFVSDDTPNPIEVQDLHGEINALDLNEPVKINLSASTRSSQGESGKISIKAKIHDIVKTDGEYNGDGLSLKLDSTLQQIPVSLVDSLLNMDGLVVATLGSSADIQLNTEFQQMLGPLKLRLNSQNAQANVEASLQKQGLVLSQDLTAEVIATPEFGRKVLSKIHPIFETTQRSQQPIRFTMPKAGVLVPIEDYDLSKVIIPQMQLDLGKVILESGWLLRGIVELANRFGQLDSVDRDQWVAWFTPAVLELNQGQAKYLHRLDLLLADKIHLGTWGNADIDKDQADLVLAFMPNTMKRLFSIEVAQNDALHIPITGSLTEPQMNFKQAALEIGRLRAQEELAGDNDILGTVLGAAAGKLKGKDGRIPSPSVEPLPWQELLNALDQASKQEQSGQTKQTQSSEPKSTEEQLIQDLLGILGKKKKQE